MKSRSDSSTVGASSMRELLEFYAELDSHNEKSWFDANKEQYLKVKRTRDALALGILSGLSALDASLRGLGIGDITYRIYQDMRFHDRPPYKNWVGIYCARAGKKSPYAGYYMHIEPCTETYFLCAGLYREDRLLQKSVREDIMLSPDAFSSCIEGAEGWKVDWEGALKRTPPGYDGCKVPEYLRLKRYLIVKDIDRRFLLKEGLPERVASEFERTVPFVSMLNRAVDYAIEEWGYGNAPSQYR